MFRAFERSHHLIAYALFGLACCSLALVLSTSSIDFSRVDYKVDLQSSTIKLRSVSHWPYKGTKGDAAFFNFNLWAGFSQVFNWNVKQVYVYLVAEYATYDNPRNEVIFWDAIILRGDETFEVDVRNEAQKYILSDEGSGFRNNKIKVYLGWNVIRNVGHMEHHKSATPFLIELSSEYS